MRHARSQFIIRIACLAIAGTLIAAESSAGAAKLPGNFGDIVLAEEKAGLLNYPPLAIYSETNPAPTPKLVTLPKQDKVTQYGITWTFDKPVPVGQFINGDYYIIGPATVVMIDPKPQFGADVIEPSINQIEVQEDKYYSGKRARHGSMLNPKIHQKPGIFVSTCGFDSRVPSQRYDPKMFTPLPIAMKAGDSLVSSISRPNDQIKSFSGQHVDAIRAVAVLSCVDAPLPLDAFRPSFCESSTCKPYRSSQLRRPLLLRLAKPSEAPAKLNRYARIFQRPYEDIADFGFSIPQENMQHYGQQLVDEVGEATLLLQMDYAPEDKERLLVNFVQVGIDFWGLARSGRLWQAHGGLNSGRKWPIVFGGMLLGDAEMQSPNKTIPTARFHEDDQTMFFPVTYNGKTFEKHWTGAKVMFVGHSPWSDGGSRGEWKTGWGPIELFHPSEWPLPGKEVLASEGYRMANTSCSWVAEALAARLMHAEKNWNHDAFFAYVDRWMTQDDTEYAKAIAAEKGRRDTTKLKFGAFNRQGNVNSKGRWVRDMWSTWRSQIPPGPDGTPTPKAEDTWK